MTDEPWTTAGKPLVEPFTPYVEQVVLDGAQGSKFIVTVRLYRNGAVSAGEAIRMVWRAGWAVARALDSERVEVLGIKAKVGEPGWDAFTLNPEESTIGNEPEYGAHP